MTKVHAFLTRSLGCQSHKFFHVGLARGQQSGDDSATLACQLIAVAAADSLNDAVCSEQCQRTADASALSTQFSQVGPVWIQSGSQVAITKAANCPLAPIDQLQQRRIGFRPGIEAAVAPPIPPECSTHCPSQFTRALSSACAGQSFQITVINGFTDLSSTVQVPDTLAQHLPALPPLRVPFTGSVNPELVRTVERRFHPQDTTLLVIKLDRIAIGLMLETQSLRTAFQAAQDFPLMIAMDSPIDLSLVAQKAQHVCATEMFDALMN